MSYSVVKKEDQVSPHHVFFVIHGMQIGVGMLGFERIVAEHAEQDAWISVLLSGLALHLILWMMYKILERGKGDIFQIHHQMFGRVFGNIVSGILFFYVAALFVNTLRSYEEVIEVWMFPQLNTWFFSGVLVILAFYFVAGGFQVVTGIAIFSLLVGLPLVLLEFYPLKEAHFINLLPVLNHSWTDMLLSTRSMTFTNLGVEFLLFFYLYIKEPNKSKKWAHYGVAFTTSIYLLYLLVAITYFSAEKLKITVWASLTLWKTVDLPFIDRFEYMGIAIWLFVILSNLALTLWSAQRYFQTFSKVSPRKITLLLCIIMWITSNLFKGRIEINYFTNFLNQFGFYFLFIYIPFLFLLQRLIQKMRSTTNAKVD
ncbi:GerAB/ArcD/ProY family transporter [Risungbinella massiliensis]|uniref:GerAB/ArcD/ProY family transporter n=1 Tax=Risungbinella massiliensis TaxID=1329796 RepID=UPI0005CBB3B4|nr:GerAB/ArcD/ProY family transporter [Risungbinella massiliensis]